MKNLFGKLIYYCTSTGQWTITEIFYVTTQRGSYSPKRDAWTLQWYSTWPQERNIGVNDILQSSTKDYRLQQNAALRIRIRIRMDPQWFLVGWIQVERMTHKREKRWRNVYCFEQCCGSALVSMRTQIQLFISMGIRIQVAMKNILKGSR